MNNKLSKLFIVILTTLLFVVITPTSCIFTEGNEGSTDITAIVKQERTITINQPEHGKIYIIEPTKIYAGDEISFEVVPDEGYELKSLAYYADDSSETIDITSTKKLIMPDEDITVVAIFKTKDGTIIVEPEVNTDKIDDAGIAPISKSEALTILGTSIEYEELRQAINEDEDVIIYANIEDPEDDTVFESQGITRDNAVIFDINLYAEILGDPSSKKQIHDTNNYKVKVSITLTKQQASKISIDSNKDYFVIREHNGQIETINASMEEKDGNYVFTFETDKFSTYAIYSKDKIPSPSPTPHFIIPETGIVGLLTGNNTSSNIFKLVLVVIVVCVVIIFGSKNKKK